MFTKVRENEHFHPLLGEMEMETFWEVTLEIDVKIFFSTHTKEITKDAQNISHGFIMG